MFTIKGTRETLPAADSHSFTQVLLEVWREKQSQGTGLPILDIERLAMKCNTRLVMSFQKIYSTCIIGCISSKLRSVH